MGTHNLRIIIKVLGDAIIFVLLRQDLTLYPRLAFNSRFSYCSLLSLKLAGECHQPLLVLLTSLKGIKTGAEGVGWLVERLVPGVHGAPRLSLSTALH